MSVRATTRRGRPVWMIQVIRDGGAFNRRRFLDRKLFLKKDALAAEAELLAEYEATSSDHPEQQGAATTIHETTVPLAVEPIAATATATATATAIVPVTRPTRTSSKQPTTTEISRKEIPTFATFAARYLALQDPTRSDFANKDRNLRLHLIPFIGDRRLDELGREAIDDLKVKLRRSSGHVPSSLRSLHRKEAPVSNRRWGGPRSPKTINNVLTTLRSVLGLAFDYELIHRIPRIKMEPLPRRDPGFLTEVEAEVERLLAAAPTAWRLMILTATYTGLRRGELLSLRWGDLHLDAPRPTIRVQRTLKYERGGVIREKGPKGGRPRSVPMTAALTSMLDEYRRADAAPTDLVFTDDATGTYVDYRQLWRVLTTAARDAGLARHVHPHLLRHTFASHCYMRGVPPQIVQQWLVTRTSRPPSATPTSRRTRARCSSIAWPRRCA